MRNMLALLVFTSFTFHVTAQYTREASRDSLQHKSDYEKIVFINKNHYSLYSADLKNAYELLNEASRLAEKSGWKNEEAFSNMYWGVVTYLMGRYDEVQPKYFKALTLFEEQKNKSGIAAVHNELAVFYRRQKDTVNHNASLAIAEENAREVNDMERLGTTFGHRGVYYSTKGDFIKARFYFEEVYKIRKQLKDSVGLGYVLIDLAELANLDKNLSGAIQYIDESIFIRKQIQDVYGVAVSTVTKGAIYLEAKHTSDAIHWLETGLQLAKQVNYPEEIKRALGLLAEIHTSNANYKAALDYRQQQYALQDSLMNLERIRSIQEMQTKYETEKKELQLAEQQLKLERNQWLIFLLVIILLLFAGIVLVWRRNAAIRQRQLLAEKQQEYQAKLIESVIALQEKERARVAKDLHDGFGQYISTVQLYVSQTTESWKQNATDLLNQMHKEVRNIAFDLLPHTLVSAGLTAALKELAIRINSSNRIRIELHTNNVERLDNGLEVSLYRVCQEWINNVLKYNNATAININIVQHETELSLLVEDNGEGFDAALLDKSKGNGWRNMQSRVQLYRGNVFVESTVGRKGTTLIIDVPLAIAQLKVA